MTSELPEGTEIGTSTANLEHAMNLLLGVMNDIEAEMNRGELTFYEAGLYRATLDAAHTILSIRHAHKRGEPGLRFPDVDPDPYYAAT